jgi:hypothetical protein
MISPLHRLPCLHPGTILAAALFLSSAVLPTTSGQAQQLVPSANGFSYGTSSGNSSFYRQESRSEANMLIQVLTTNVVPVGDGYSIVDPNKSFAVNEQRLKESAADRQITVGGATFSGSSYSVFSN